jgi:hypothetical protein
MLTLDLRTEFKHLYRPSAKTPALVDVPPMTVMAVDGEGMPGEERFQEAMQALFTLAYTTRFASKKELDIDYPVMPPEGLYWDASGGPLTADAPPSAWAWTLQIMIPAEVPAEFIEKCRTEAASKGKGGPLLGAVEVRRFDEGTCVQLMHVGPYDTEPATIARMVEFAAANGYEITGDHHEIYIGDPNRSAPEKLKTTLRLGVTRTAPE